MKWEDVIQACENLGYSPEDLLKLMQVHEKLENIPMNKYAHYALERTKE